MDARVAPAKAASKARRVWPFRPAPATPQAARPEKREKRDLVVWIARARRELSS